MDGQWLDPFSLFAQQNVKRLPFNAILLFTAETTNSKYLL